MGIKPIDSGLGIDSKAAGILHYPVEVKKVKPTRIYTDGAEAERSVSHAGFHKKLIEMPEQVKPGRGQQLQMENWRLKKRKEWAD